MNQEEYDKCELICNLKENLHKIYDDNFVVKKLTKSETPIIEKAIDYVDTPQEKDELDIIAEDQKRKLRELETEQV